MSIKKKDVHILKFKTTNESNLSISVLYHLSYYLFKLLNCLPKKRYYYFVIVKVSQFMSENNVENVHWCVFCAQNILKSFS